MTSTNPSTTGDRTTYRAVHLADRWGCSTGHLANLRCDNRGPKFYRWGNTVLYRHEDVIAYENQYAVDTLDSIALNAKVSA